jgi:hypothetical protein
VLLSTRVRTLRPPQHAACSRQPPAAGRLLRSDKRPSHRCRSTPARLLDTLSEEHLSAWGMTKRRRRCDERRVRERAARTRRGWTAERGARSNWQQGPQPPHRSRRASSSRRRRRWPDRCCTRRFAAAACCCTAPCACPTPTGALRQRTRERTKGAKMQTEISREKARRAAVRRCCVLLVSAARGVGEVLLTLLLLAVRAPARLGSASDALCTALPSPSLVSSSRPRSCAGPDPIPCAAAQPHR